MTFLSPGTASHQLAPKTFLKECTCESIFGTPQGKKFKIKPRLWVSGLAGAPILRLVEKAGHTVRIPKSRVRAGMLLHILWI